jgi:hypothetical protein
VAAGRLSNIGTTAETLRLKSPSMVPATAKGVGSIVTTRLPETTNGTLLVTAAPASVSKVRFWLPVRTFTVSPPPPRLIAPMIFEPGSSVSVSGLTSNCSAAVPPVMMPELVTFATPPKPARSAIPLVPPVMVPELITLAVLLELMPTEPLPLMVPEFVTLATISAKMPWSPVMVPELVTLAVVATMPALPAPPVMVPELATLAVVARMPPKLPPVMLPELSTVPSEKKMPRAVPVTLAPGTTVMVLPVSVMLP